MKKVIAIILMAAMAVQGAQYSKLGIITAAKACGRWPALKAWIAQSGYEDEWIVCNYLSDDFPQFETIVAAIVDAGVATAEEAAAILEASHDTALPDTLMVSRYRRDMASSTGRREWHGPYTTSIDTNRLVRVYIYEDGYTHEEPWTPPKPKVQVDLERARQTAQRLNARADKLAPDAAARLRARAAAILADAEAAAAGNVPVETIEIGPGAVEEPTSTEGETGIDVSDPPDDGGYGVEPMEGQ
jgi:hypothetical protein